MDSDHDHTDIETKTNTSLPKSAHALEGALALPQFNPESTVVRNVEYQYHPNTWSRI
ncbi:hypothetical protein FRC02_008574, partial [Tulasnella sp. 418]